MKLPLLICWLLILKAGVFANDNRPLVAGMELSYPPFETIDAYGNPSGISVDLVKAFGKYLNVPIKIDNIPFIGLIPALKTDKIDFIVSSMSATDERKESIAFSIPYLRMGLCLLVNIHSSIQNIVQADQPGKKIVVKQGTTGEIYARENVKNAKVYVLDKEASCVLEVVQGKADAFIYDQFSVYMNWQRNLSTTRALLTPFKYEDWAIGIRKNDQKLLDQVNAFLVKFREENGFDKLTERYFSEQKAAFKKLGIPFFL